MITVYNSRKGSIKSVDFRVVYGFETFIWIDGRVILRFFIWLLASSQIKGLV